MAGTMLSDGFSTTITLTTSDLTFMEETKVKPPGVDGGDPIPRTTMLNTAVRTQKPPKLKSFTPVKVTARYDPQILAEAITACNINQEIVVTHPDGQTWTFWGWLKSAEPNENEEGSEVTMELEFILSNLNASDVETAPVRAAAAT
jgi:hypothetical protein